MLIATIAVAKDLLRHDYPDTQEVADRLEPVRQAFRRAMEVLL